MAERDSFSLMLDELKMQDAFRPAAHFCCCCCVCVPGTMPGNVPGPAFGTITGGDGSSYLNERHAAGRGEEMWGRGPWTT